MKTYYVAAHPGGGFLLKRENDKNYHLNDDGSWFTCEWHADPLTWHRNAEKWEVVQVDLAVIKMFLFAGEIIPTPCCT